MIIGGYWPSRTVTDITEQHHTLWQKTERWITSQKLKDNSPIEYIQRLTMRWAYKALSEQAVGIILCGDLNSTWTRMENGGGRTLQKWATDHQWINGPRLITDHLQVTNKMYTHKSRSGNSWIDHTLHMGDICNVDPVSTYVATGNEWDDISDHIPMWTLFAVPSPSTSVKRVTPHCTPPRQDLQTTNIEKVGQYKDIMSSYAERHPFTDQSPEEAGTICTGYP